MKSFEILVVGLIHSYRFVLLDSLSKTHVDFSFANNASVLIPIDMRSSVIQCFGHI